MSAIYARSVIDEYPGAGVIIPGDLSVGDCEEHPSLQGLVLEIGGGAAPLYATTIVGGLAYTEAAVGDLTTICTPPPPAMAGELVGDVVVGVPRKKQRRRKRKS